MKKYLLLVALGLSVNASFALKFGDEHLKGYISDSTCAAAKTEMSPDARAACVNKCIKKGAKAVLVVGDKVYQTANQKAAVKYAGKDVTVDGAVTNDSIQITKIEETK